MAIEVYDTGVSEQKKDVISLPGPFQRFFRKIVQGSYPLFMATVIALIWANVSPHSYHDVWHKEFSMALGHFQISKSLVHWIDEALMSLFFFTVGLEIKREILVGGLSSPKQALLPIAAAAGGMIVPAVIYGIFNYGGDTINGWAVPMATDIAFSLAILSALGTRIPIGLKLFLTAFAIADDLGAVVVIALFYTKSIVWSSLGVSALFLSGLAIANRFWIRSTLVYVILGLGLWSAVLGSGIHATVAGVIVAMFIPARGKYDTNTFLKNVGKYLHAFDCESESCGYSILLNRRHLNAVQAIDLACRNVETPLQRLEHGLQSWIAYVVLPLFALANAGLTVKGIDISSALLHPVTLGIMLGLVLGKPVGISLFTFLSVKILGTFLPSGVNWRQIMGAGLLGGIGFTMSLFISGLSFANPELLDVSKLGILAGSVVSALAGYILLMLAVEPEAPST